MRIEKTSIKSSVRFKWWHVSHPVLSHLIGMLSLLSCIGVCSFFLGRASAMESGISGISSTLLAFFNSWVIWFLGASLAFVWLLDRRKPLWKRFLEHAKQHNPQLASQFEELAYRDGLIKDNRH